MKNGKEKKKRNCVNVNVESMLLTMNNKLQRKKEEGICLFESVGCLELSIKIQ